MGDRPRLLAHGRARSHARTIGLLATFVAAAAAAAAAIAAPTRAQAAATTAPSITVHTSTGPVAAGQASETPVTAGCPAGSVLTGGGIHVYYSGPPLDPSTMPYEPINGLIMRGTTPSDAAGDSSSNGDADPSHWTAVGGFAGQFEAVDSDTAFALCSTTADGPQHTTVVTNTINGPTIPSTTAQVTATCPAGTRLVGGGARMIPASSASSKPDGSYPSDATGALAATDDPDSWTAVGEAGGQMNIANMTTAYALCSTGASLHTTVVRADDIDHPNGPGNSTTPGADPIATATATCPATTQLLSGGALAIGSATGDDRGNLQQGVHVRGSYPSDAGGVDAPDGATAPSSWTAIVQSGGTPTPGTDTFAYALCAKPPIAGDETDLAVTDDDAPDPVTAGEDLTYTVKVSNNGPQAATGVALTQPLPAGVTFVSASSTIGTCASSAGTVTCAIGSLASGEQATVTIVVTTSAAGTLAATATVSGDASQTDPVAGNDSATATTTVALPVKAVPTLGGHASASVAAGATITDTATLAGGFTPTGTIAFDLFGPGDDTCATSLQASTQTVAGDGDYTSAPFTATHAGTYRWRARYGGDDSNDPAGPTDCSAADPGQTVTVTEATPTLSERTTPPTATGAQIGAVAALEGGVHETGTVTLQVFAADDSGCATPLDTTVQTVAGDGAYVSHPFTPADAGTYRWLASYSGDDDNAAVPAPPCASAATAVVSSAAAALPSVGAYRLRTGLEIGAGAALPVTARCPAGSQLTGGGGLLERPGASAPSPNLKLDGLAPDVSADPGSGPLSAWNAVPAFGGQSESGDVATAYALCAATPPVRQVVAIQTTGSGDTAVAPTGVTATCPTGTRLTGGGALATPASSPSFRPVASFPSDALGRAALANALDPGSWTAIGAATSSTPDLAITAYAICSADPALHTDVARVDAAGPQAPGSSATVTATCPSGAPLLSGGVRLDASGTAPAQGVHLDGSYPSDAAGAPASALASDTVAPRSWTAIGQAGSQSALGTDERVFALCAVAAPVPPPPPPPPPVITPLPPPLPPPATSPAPAPPAATTGQIATSLRHDIVPTGRSAHIAVLLRKDGIGLAVKALRAGRATVSWYRVTKGKKGRKIQTLVASGRLSYTRARTATIRIRPTAYGKRVLKHAKRIALTAKGTFTPAGAGKAVTASRTFVLRR